MARLETHLPHIVWREGRPRFVPGPGLRALGYKGEDLRHGAHGPWLTREEAHDWAQDRLEAIERQRSAAALARSQKKRLAPPARGGQRAVLTVAGLFEDFFALNPRMKGEAQATGKRTVAAASPRTIGDYAKKAQRLARFDRMLHEAPAEALTPQIVYDLYERMWSAIGLASARGIVAVLSAALSWGIRTGRVRLPVNPCMNLGMTMPEPRLRAGTPAEVYHLIRAADLIGRPEIGDAIMLGVWTGQRQIDRLALADLGLVEGRRIFRQSKTGAIVAINETRELAARMQAARARRADWRLNSMLVIMDEQQTAPLKADHYRHLYAQVRASAVAGVKDAATGAQLLPPMPSLEGFRDQDLRDTAVTWLARAGCTHMEIAAITGHSLETIHSILKHYLASHPELADNAVAKLVTWFDGQTAENKPGR